MIKLITKKVFLLLSCSLLIFNAKTQNVNNPSPDYCGHSLFKNKLKTDANFKNHYNTIEKQIYNQLKSSKSLRVGSTNQIYSIPVVVHVIHLTGTPIGTNENISNAQIAQGLQDLNDAFRHRGNFNGANGADIEIEFCLAKRDPQGNQTTGINRIANSLSNVTIETQDAQLKSIIQWDPTQYLNIWLVNEITSTSSAGSGVAGYSTLAASHGLADDGIVNEARYFGSSTDNSKVHIHEAGHYFNLLHTWESGCKNDDCLADGDKVCDTPPDNSIDGILCTSSANTCHTDSDDPAPYNPFHNPLVDANDMIRNYMDYGYQECQNIFTQGQKERMIAALTTVRASLLESKACLDPCPTPFTVSISSSQTNYYAGATYNFTAQSSSTGLTYQWNFGDGTTGTGNQINHIFTEIGKYTVKLTGNNGNNLCVYSDEVIVDVKCAITADIAPLATLNYDRNATVSFINQSSSQNSLPVTYEWFLNGVSQGNQNDLTLTFPQKGNYTVKLVASNQNCSSETEKVITVSNLTVDIVGTRKRICKGEKVVLYALGSSSRIWGFDGSTGSYIEVSPNTTTTYTLTSAGETVSYTIDVCEDANCAPEPVSAFNPFLLSTGNNGYTTTLSDASTDLHWEVGNGLYHLGTNTDNNGQIYIDQVSDPNELPTNVVFSPAYTFQSNDNFLPSSYHRSTWANVRWIGPSPTFKSVGRGYNDGTNPTLDGMNVFYRLKFNLDKFQSQNTQLAMQFMADNQVSGIFVNDYLYENSVPNPIYGFSGGFTTGNALTINLTGPWKEGENIIIVRIRDGGGLASFLAQLLPSTDVPIPGVGIVDPGCITNNTQLISNIPGGVWSASCGNCISSTGLFNTSTSGVGEFDVSYAKNCQTATLKLKVCPPTCDVEIVANNSIVCVGDQVTLTASMDKPLTDYNFEWIDKATNNVLSTLSSFTTTLSNTKTIKVNVTSKNGNCSSSDEITIFTTFISNVLVESLDENCTPEGCAKIKFTPIGGASPFKFSISGQPTVNSNGALEFDDCVLGNNKSITITDRNGCAITKTYDANCNTSDCIIDLNPSYTVCKGESITLDAKASCDTEEQENKCNQAPTVTYTCNTGCTNTVTNNNKITVLKGQKVCIPNSYTFTGPILMKGGTLVVCGNVNNSDFVMEGGDLIVNGTFETTNINMNSNSVAKSIINYGTIKSGGGSFNGQIENYGTITLSEDFNINSVSKFLNQGTIKAKKSFNCKNSVVNNGTLDVGFDLKCNGNSTFENNCTVTVGNNFNIDEYVANNGKITVSGTTFHQTAGKSLEMGNGALLETGNFYFQKPIVGSTQSCGLIKVLRTNTINSGASISGNLSVCNLGTVINNVPSIVSYFNCQCTATGVSGSTNKIQYEWTPTTGINNPSNSVVTITPSASTTYTVKVLDTETNTILTTKNITILVNCDPVGINDGLVNNNIDLFPNPSNSEFEVTVSEPGEIQVIDLLGRIVYQNEIQNTLKLGNNLEVGTYLVKFKSKSLNKTVKFIKN